MVQQQRHPNLLKVFAILIKRSVTPPCPMLQIDLPGGIGDRVNAIAEKEIEK
jgi:hypothetical protein